MAGAAGALSSTFAFSSSFTTFSSAGAAGADVSWIGRGG